MLKKIAVLLMSCTFAASVVAAEPAKTHAKATQNTVKTKKHPSKKHAVQKTHGKKHQAKKAAHKKSVALSHK